MELDKTDKHILDILQVDAKITNAALAQKINLSPAATLERVKKLEQHGIIVNYGAQVDYAKLGYQVHLIVGVRLQKSTTEHLKLFKHTVDKISFITTCYQVIGAFDFILFIHTHHMAHYQTMVIEKLYMLPMVEEVQTLPVTQLLKNKPLYLS